MSLNILKTLYIKKCFLLSNHAEPSPPLGTILGNLGVNTLKFCDDLIFILKTYLLIFILKLSLISLKIDHILLISSCLAQGFSWIYLNLKKL